MHLQANDYYVGLTRKGTGINDFQWTDGTQVPCLSLYQTFLNLFKHSYNLISEIWTALFHSVMSPSLFLHLTQQYGMLNLTIILLQHKGQSNLTMVSQNEKQNINHVYCTKMILRVYHINMIVENGN